MRTPLLEQPDCYREGGGGIGGLFKGITQLITGAPSIDMPQIKQPDKIHTGTQVAEKAGGSFDEEAESKSKARQTARKGTSKFRIPLANIKAGASVGGGTGLKI